MPETTLTAKQQRFVDQYLLDCNATQAAIRAGYSKKTANEIGCENLAKPSIAAAIKARQLELRKHTDVTRDRLINELTCIALLDPGEMFDNHGNPIEIAELPPHLRRAVASYEICEEFEGKGESRKAVGYTKKVKFWDKLAALKQLGEMLGYTEPAPLSPEEQSVTIVFVDSNGRRTAQPPKTMNPLPPGVTLVPGR